MRATRRRCNRQPAAVRKEGCRSLLSLLSRAEVAVGQTIRYRSVGSNLPEMLEVSACRRESRAVRYSNSPSGETARTLTRDDICHPDRSQSNVVAFAGCRILRIFVGLPKRPGSMLPVVRHDASSSVARLCYRGVDRRLDSVWRPGGVDRIGRSPTDHTFGSGPILRERCWAHTQIRERFAAVPFELIGSQRRKTVR